MGVPRAGTIVVVHFPFSDLSHSKLRPALVLARMDRNDVVLCQITSKPYSDINAIKINQASLFQGNLHRASYVRPGKLFTANSTIIVRKIGKLTGGVHRTIVDSIISLLRDGIPV